MHYVISDLPHFVKSVIKFRSVNINIKLRPSRFFLQQSAVATEGQIVRTLNFKVSAGGFYEFLNGEFSTDQVSEVVFDLSDQQKRVR